MKEKGKYVYKPRKVYQIVADFSFEFNAYRQECLNLPKELPIRQDKLDDLEEYTKRIGGKVPKTSTRNRKRKVKVKMIKTHDGLKYLYILW